MQTRNSPDDKTNDSAHTPAGGPDVSSTTAPCLRCRQTLPTDDDGFCDACRKALEEACL